MTLRIGDSVFIRSGDPAIVKSRDPATGKLRLDQEYAHVQHEMRHGYINGLPAEDREQLYRILDEVKGDTTDPRERVEKIGAHLAEIESDPTRLPLTRYLRAEMAHIMNTHNIRPREYTANEIKAR